MRYRAVLFDMDYTLGDATDGILTCFRTALSGMGYPDYPDDTLRCTIGHTLEDSFSLVTGEQAEEKRAQFRRRYGQKADSVMVHALHLFPETLPLLRHLQAEQCQMAVVSTRPVARLDAMLQAAGIRSFFQTLVGVDSVSQPKPSPDALLEAMARCGVGQRETLYIGDTIIDAEAAARAAVDFAAVTTGTTPKSAFAAFPACLIADHLGEVLNWMKRKTA